MKSSRIHRRRFSLLVAPIVLSGLTLGCASTSSWAVGADPGDPALAPAPAADPVPLPAADAASYPDVPSALRGVQQATTPDQALAAYSAGLGLDPNNVALQEAYVRRLVDLNAPQLAEPAARRLLGVRPDSPLAWAVVAFAEAKRGNLIDALTDIALSAKRLPGDPFVQRTTGELLAWYDNVPTKPTLAAGIAGDLETVRRSLNGQPTFAEAYGKAGDFYKNPPRPAAPPAQADAGGAPPAGSAAPDAGAPPQAASPYGSATPAPAQPPAPGYPAPAYPAPAPQYPAPGYSADVYAAPPPVTTYVDSYVPAYAVPQAVYSPGYYSSGYCYPGCDVGVGFGVNFSLPLLYLGGDWGWCGGGGWHRHWDDWGRGYAYGGYHSGRDYGYRGGYGGRDGYRNDYNSGRAYRAGVDSGLYGRIVRGSDPTYARNFTSGGAGRTNSRYERAPSSAAPSRYGLAGSTYRPAAPHSGGSVPHSSFSTPTPRYSSASPHYTPSRSGSYSAPRASSSHYSSPLGHSSHVGSGASRGGGSFHSSGSGGHSGASHTGSSHHR